MKKKNKVQEEYISILKLIEGRIPKNYTKFVREKLGKQKNYVSDFTIQNVKNGKTANIKIARILLEIADEWCPQEV